MFTQRRDPDRWLNGPILHYAGDTSRGRSNALLEPSQNIEGRDRAPASPSLTRLQDAPTSEQSGPPRNNEQSGPAGTTNDDDETIFGDSTQISDTNTPDNDFSKCSDTEDSTKTNEIGSVGTELENEETELGSQHQPGSESINIPEIEEPHFSKKVKSSSDRDTSSEAESEFDNINDPDQKYWRAKHHITEDFSSGRTGSSKRRADSFDGNTGEADEARSAPRNDLRAARRPRLYSPDDDDPPSDSERQASKGESCDDLQSEASTEICPNIDAGVQSTNVVGANSPSGSDFRNDDASIRLEGDVSGESTDSNRNETPTPRHLSPEMSAPPSSPDSDFTARARKAWNWVIETIVGLRAYQTDEGMDQTFSKHMREWLQSKAERFTRATCNSLNLELHLEDLRMPFHQDDPLALPQKFLLHLGLQKLTAIHEFIRESLQIMTGMLEGLKAELHNFGLFNRDEYRPDFNAIAGHPQARALFVSVAEPLIACSRGRARRERNEIAESDFQLRLRLSGGEEESIRTRTGFHSGKSSVTTQEPYRHRLTEHLVPKLNQTQEACMRDVQRLSCEQIIYSWTGVDRFPLIVPPDELWQKITGLPWPGEDDRE